MKKTEIEKTINNLEKIQDLIFFAKVELLLIRLEYLLKKLGDK